MTTKTPTITAKPVYLDLHAAATFVSLSEATIQKLVRENQFPHPRKISANRVAFLTEELEVWAKDRPISDLLPPPQSATAHGTARQKKHV